MKLEPNTLDSLLEEFRLDVLDFQCTLLTLECLRSYWEKEELQQRYPQDIFVQARRNLDSYLTQYAQELSQSVVWMKTFCANSRGA